MCPHKPSSQALRVALVGPGFPPAVGGVESVMAAHARGLAAHGCQVDVLVQCRRADPPVPKIAAWADGVTVRRFPSWTRSHHFPIAPQLARYLRQHIHEFDIVHGHSYHAIPALAAATAGAESFVLTPHYHGSGHTPSARALHRVYGPVARRVFARSDAIIAVSRAEAQLIARDFGVRTDSLSIIPNGIDDELVHPGERFDVGIPVVLVAGRLERYKQVDVVVRAMDSHEMPEARLVVAGDGPSMASLEAARDALRHPERVDLLGVVPTFVLRQWQRTAAVVVSLSRHEAFGMVLLEGIACGAAIVASDIPAHREIQGRVPSAQIAYVPADADPNLVARVIRDQMATPGHRASGARTSGIVTWDDVARQHIDLYQRIRDPGSRLHRQHVGA
jgi:glycosyltransferase involved in cell wall biosynthesis